MKVGSIDCNRRVLVVAEIGNNHEGDFERAKEMIRRAAECQVDAVKFQSVEADRLVRRTATERLERLRKFELSARQFEQLAASAKELGLAFLSTPLSLNAADYLQPLVDAYKIASGDNNFLPLLDRVAKTKKPVILSTGVSDVPRIQASVDFLHGCWQRAGVDGELALLHCVSCYPTPPDQANLASIPFLKQTFGMTVGYSDHVLGIEASVIAVAAGARIIEKHFTLDKHQSDFRDHELSADPGEMARLVRRIRETEVLLGAFDKRIQPSEEQTAAAIRRSIAAVRPMKAGTRLEWADLKWVRPADGLTPGMEDRLVGRALKRDIDVDHSFSLDDVE